MKKQNPGLVQESQPVRRRKELSRAVPATLPAANARGAAQRFKTRQAILRAASEMTAAGLIPGVAEAAERAGVSRATAYRHFPSREFLVVEMALPIQQLREALLQAGQSDPARRIGAMVRTIAVWSFDHQLVLREMLRVSLAPEQERQGYVRPNTRLELIAHQLKPMRSLMSRGDYRRLSTALTLIMGIEPVIVLQDMAQASRTEAIDTLVWIATRLMQSTLRRAPK